jgi:RimJ/RimL family protein N-acetyltransferase
MKLKQGQVIEEFEHGGKKCVLRIIRKDDLQGCLKHINSIIREKAFIGWHKQFTVEKEKEWLSNELRGLKEGNRAALIAEKDGRILGCSVVFRGPEDAKMHRATVGISLSSDRGKGLGYRILCALERIAKECMNCKILELNVYEPNVVARKLYEKGGFREAGRIKNGCKHYGKYYDDILMVKHL